MNTKAIESCCEPLLREPLADEDAESLAAAFKVLSDPVRLRILSLIANTPAGELCACDMKVDRSQPTVSHHLTILTEAGLLEREQRGKWAWFRIVPERFAILQDALKQS